MASLNLSLDDLWLVDHHGHSFAKNFISPCYTYRFPGKTRLAVKDEVRELSSPSLLLWLNLVPNQQQWYAKWKLSWNTCTYTMHTTRFCTFGANLYAQSVLINKISASKLSRKFIKSVLLVG